MPEVVYRSIYGSDIVDWLSEPTLIHFLYLKISDIFDPSSTFKSRLVNKRNESVTAFSLLSSQLRYGKRLLMNVFRYV